MPKTRLLIYEPSFERVKAELAAFRDLEPVVMTDDGGAAAGLSDLDVAWLSTEMFLGPAAAAFIETVLRAPRLKWAQSAGAGYDAPVFHRIVANGVRLSTSHAQAVGIAEFVLAGVLDHFQKGAARRAAQAQRAWRRLPAREMTGTSWLIVGFGAIGQAVAERARAFGVQVIGVRRAPGPHPAADRVLAISDLSEALPHADVVVLCLPLTDATRALFGVAHFQRMKPGAVFVNVGRGALVDEAALLDGLEAGRPAHAILDVFQTEPLPPDSPFWSHPSVGLSPHASALSDGLTARNDALFVENLGRYLAGEPLLNELDPREIGR